LDLSLQHWESYRISLQELLDLSATLEELLWFALLGNSVMFD
jgi:hypothetical protein